MVTPFRTRIGIITPDDAVNDDEYWRFVNDDVTILLDRYRTPQRFAPIDPGMVSSYGALDLLADAAETLRITRPQAIAFFCNSCSFVGGKQANLDICRTITEGGQAPGTTISLAQVEALRVLGARKVAIGAPYSEEVTSHLHRFLREYDFEVISSKSLGMTTEWQIGNSEPSVWERLARDVNSSEADCILLACSGIRTSSILEELEQELGKPIISAPAAGIWHALRLADYSRPVTGRGVLLANHLGQ